MVHGRGAGKVIDSLPPLREVIAKHGLVARKSLGQNFLLDFNLTRKIARGAGDLGECTILEVGPGPGGLTRALLMEGAAKVIAVERDARCVPALEGVAATYPDRLEIIEADAMEIDERRIAKGAQVKIVANLPYNVGTALLIKWLTPEAWPPFWASLTLMFQTEVAERIVAAPGTKAYGRLAVLAQWRASPSILFEVPAAAFVPPPKVSSAIVHIEPMDPPANAPSVAALERVTAAAFGQRRKMLRAALKQLGPSPEALLEAAGIDPTARAEEVDVAGFCRLARAFEGA